MTQRSGIIRHSTSSIVHPAVGTVGIPSPGKISARRESNECFSFPQRDFDPQGRPPRPPSAPSQEAAGLLRHQSDEWATSRDRFAEWDRKSYFDLDVAATTENALCARFCAVESDGLVQGLPGTVRCIPPHSSVGKWVKKAYESSLADAIVVCLVPPRTDTRWWQEWATRAKCRFITGRLHFGEEKSGRPFPSILLVFRPSTADEGSGAAPFGRRG